MWYTILIVIPLFSTCTEAFDSVEHKDEKAYLPAILLVLCSAVAGCWTAATAPAPALSLRGGRPSGRAAESRSKSAAQLSCLSRRGFEGRGSGGGSGGGRPGSRRGGPGRRERRGQPPVAASLGELPSSKSRRPVQRVDRERNEGKRPYWASMYSFEHCRKMKLSLKKS
jgi:hypothetical protein